MTHSADPDGLLEPLISELVTDSSLSHYVQNLIQQQPILVRFRPDIEHCFHTKRTQEFSQIFRIASALWLLLFVVIFLGTYLNFPYIFQSNDYLIWQSTFAFTTALLHKSNLS